MKTFSIGSFILQFAIGAMLAVGGIWALQGGGDAACLAIKDIFNGDVRNIMVVVFGIIEIIAGIFLLISLFLPNPFVSIKKLCMIIVAIVWVCAIVLCDFLGNHGILNGGAKNFLSWLYSFAEHLIVLGGILYLV